MRLQCYTSTPGDPNNCEPDGPGAEGGTEWSRELDERKAHPSTSFWFDCMAAAYLARIIVLLSFLRRRFTRLFRPSVDESVIVATTFLSGIQFILLPQGNLGEGGPFVRDIKVKG